MCLLDGSQEEIPVEQKPLFFTVFFLILLYLLKNTYCPAFRPDVYLFSVNIKNLLRRKCKFFTIHKLNFHYKTDDCISQASWQINIMGLHTERFFNDPSLMNGIRSFRDIRFLLNLAILIHKSPLYPLLWTLTMDIKSELGVPLFSYSFVPSRILL